MAQNINQMSLEQLASLQGLNREIAQEIVARRKSYPFKSLDELIEIPGIGAKKIEQLKKQGVVCLPLKPEPPPPPPTPQPSPPTATPLPAPTTTPATPPTQTRDYSPETTAPPARPSAAPPAESEAAEMFQCRSCGRTLPSGEREAGQTWARNICIACFLNIFNSPPLVDGG